MAKLEGKIRQVIDNAEWVSIATAGPDGPHLAATWGDYVRALGVDNDTILGPAGGLRTTEENLKTDARIQLLFATRQVQGSNSPGQGCRISGRGEVQAAGPAADRVKATFPWARAALVVTVEDAATQL